MAAPKLAAALRLWQEITGVDPDATRWVGMHDISVRQQNEELREAIDLDPTEITAALLLTSLLKAYLAQHPITLLDAMNNPEALDAALDKPRQLLAILNDNAIVDARERFIERLTQAVASYGAADREDVRALLARPDDLAYLRRDALRSIAKLRVDQFIDGTPEAAGVMPVYTQVVHQWWNVNSLLAASTAMPSGVSLNLIRHVDGYQSFFCFAIRNGGSLFVLSDVPDQAHPLQGYMTRKPERTLDRRACQNWFPYELLGLDYDEESGRAYLKQSAATALVAYQNAALPLQPIAQLEPPVVVWLAMMFDLIVERFWRQGYRAPALSYTAEMLKVEQALIGVAQTANLPVPAYQPIALSPLTHATIADAATTEKAVGRKYHHPHAWLEERYGAKVPASVFNLVTAPEVHLALDHKTGGVTSYDPKAREQMAFFERDKLRASQLPLETVNATSFGSREQIERDRLFIARCNFASRIDELAAEEYAARKDEVLAWYRAKVEANADTLCRYAGHEAVWVDLGEQPWGSSLDGHAGPCRSTRISDRGIHSPSRMSHAFIFRRDASDLNATGFTRQAGAHVGRFHHATHRPLCYIRGERAAFLVIFAPTNVTELAFLAGCTPDELPDVLQHWNLLKPYTGNSILDRVDPMIWRVDDPWQKLDLRVRLAFSKRGMKAIAARAEAVPLPNVIPDPEVAASDLAPSPKTAPDRGTEDEHDE